jgi:hypothetical protein
MAMDLGQRLGYIMATRTRHKLQLPTRNQPKLLILLVGRIGLEPMTKGL